MSKAHPRQVLKPRSTPADQRRWAGFNSGRVGRKSDWAAGGEQGKASRSDIDGDDANRRSTAAIEIRHALSDAAARTRLRLKPRPPRIPHEQRWRGIHSRATVARELKAPPRRNRSGSVGRPSSGQARVGVRQGPRRGQGRQDHPGTAGQRGSTTLQGLEFGQAQRREECRGTR